MAKEKSNFACIYMQNICQYDPDEQYGPWASCFGLFVCFGFFILSET
jgi:hypothetical protein